MAAVAANSLMKAFWKFHRRLLALTNGRMGTRLGPGRQLLLITKGRRSGEPRPVALSYIEDASRWVVVATNAGEDRHPAWWLNLETNPAAEVLEAGERVPVKVRAAEGEDRTYLYQRFIDLDQSYAEYRRRTAREIPVVILERA